MREGYPNYLEKHSPFLILAVFLFLIGLFVWNPLYTRFQAGRVFLTATVSQAMVENSEKGVAQMASVYDGLWLNLETLWSGTDRFFKVIANNLIYFWQQAKSAWTKFFNQEEETSSVSTLMMDVPSIEALKAEIKAELLRELGASVGQPSSSPAASGLVILPSSGDPVRDQALKAELKNSFSDRVEVRFDSSGQTGVITPIFQNGSIRGGDYLFVLTPIKR